MTLDRPVRAVGEVDLLAGDSVPAGVRRIGAGAVAKAREASTANVAVIDSGVDLSHPDLNTADGVNCVAPGTPARDQDGHGTTSRARSRRATTAAASWASPPARRPTPSRSWTLRAGASFSQVLCGIDW